MGAANPENVKIVVTGGGSGGHTSAAVGIAEVLLARGIKRENVLWIGSNFGVEKKVASSSVISFRAIAVGKFRRYWSLDNLLDIPKVFLGAVQSLTILIRNFPDMVISTGGFVSVPVVLAAFILRIPIVVHEQTLVPGLANRIAGRLASMVIVSHRRSARFFGTRKCVVIGNPLRSELRNGLASKSDSLQKLRLDPTLPVLYVTGGAQGANALNKVVGESLQELLREWQVIHQSGAGRMECGSDELTKLASELDLTLMDRYRIIPYVGPEIVDVLSAADAVLSRSGAAIVNEIIRLGLPAILVPYPQSVGDEQRYLARELEESGGAIVLEQTTLTKESLIETLNKLTPEERGAMRLRLRSLARDDVEQRLADEILGLIGVSTTKFPATATQLKA